MLEWKYSLTGLEDGVKGESTRGDKRGDREEKIKGLNGEDLRSMPLWERKRKLKRILPARSAHVLYVDHTRGSGTELFRLACQLDLEGIVAKKADSPYGESAAEPHWIKIKNPQYSQKEGRADLFKRTG